jgi:hypothetical protein
MEEGSSASSAPIADWDCADARHRNSAVPIIPLFLIRIVDARFSQLS